MRAICLEWKSLMIVVAALIGGAACGDTELGDGWSVASDDPQIGAKERAVGEAGALESSYPVYREPSTESDPPLEPK